MAVTAVSHHVRFPCGVVFFVRTSQCYIADYFIYGLSYPIAKAHAVKVRYNGRMNTIQVGALANCLGAHRDTVRRWSKDYQMYLSKGANPFPGHDRTYTRHDAAVLSFVSVQRQTRTAHTAIREQLELLRAGGWSDLPDVPDSWFAAPNDGRVAIAEVTSDATALAQVAASQVEVQTIREKYEAALQRLEMVEHELEHLRSAERAAERQIHALELELEKARGEVTALQARLSIYAFGSDAPRHIATIIAASIVFTVILVLVVFVAARLLL